MRETLIGAANKISINSRIRRQRETYEKKKTNIEKP